MIESSNMTNNINNEPNATKKKNLIFIILILLNFLALLIIVLSLKNSSPENDFKRKDYSIEVGQVVTIHNVEDVSMYTFESDNSNVATVDNMGVVTAIGPGVTTIRIKDKNNKLVMISLIEVTEDIELLLDKTEVKMNIGDSVNLQVSVFPSSYSDKIIWSSSDTAIAKVDSGKVTALKQGIVTIKAYIKDSAYVVKCKVIVSKPVVEVPKEEEKPTESPDIDKPSTNSPTQEVPSTKPSVEEKPSTLPSTQEKPSTIAVNGIILTTNNKLEMKVNDQATLQYSISPANATNKNVTWSSSNSNVVKVENGVVTALAPGTAKITVKTKDGNFTATATITVKKSVKIHFIRQNDSADVILLESNGRFAMIDTGYSDTANSEITKNYLTELNVTELEFLLITHNHRDHIGYAPKLMKNYFKKVKVLYIKSYLGNDNQYSEAQQSRYDKTIQAATEKNIPIKYIENLGDGYTIKLDEMTLKLYNTTQQMVEGKFYGKNENYNSVFQYVTIGNTKTFLAGDGFHYKTLDPAINAIGKVDLLKMPHHGYNSCGLTTTSINKLSAKNVIITNSYERLNGEYDCINKFPTTPLHYVNASDISKSIIVDYSSGNINIIKN